MAERRPDLTFALLGSNDDGLTADQEATRRDLERREHERSSFLAQLSHDLRSPLTSILGFTDLIEVELGDGTDAVALHLGAIRRNGHALLRLIDELVDVASLDAGTFHLRRAPALLGEIIAEVRTQTAARLAKDRYQVVWPDESWNQTTVEVDARRLVQALIYLVDHACDHTRPGGSIALTVQAGRPELVLVVEDNGRGIPEEDLEAIFRPFVCRETALRLGVGLGLAITRGVVLAHGGRIEVSSEAGRGTRFTLAIPAEAS